MRVFLDTNVLVSAFATRGLCADVLRLVLARHDLIVTEVILEELTRVLVEKMGIPRGKVDEIAEYLGDFVEAADKGPTQEMAIRDPSDVPVVESAIAARAEIIVTGDQDLLEANLPLTTRTPRQFWESLRRDPPGGDEVHES